MARRETTTVRERDRQCWFNSAFIPKQKNQKEKRVGNTQEGRKYAHHQQERMQKEVGNRTGTLGSKVRTVRY